MVGLGYYSKYRPVAHPHLTLTLTLTLALALTLAPPLTGSSGRARDALVQLALGALLARRVRGRGRGRSRVRARVRGACARG